MMTSTLKIVDVNSLKEGMKIISFVGFAKPYYEMNDKISQFVKHNFKGTHAKVLRKGKPIETPVENVQSGDTLAKIFKLPESMNKVTLVNDKLIMELKRRGFTKFEVILLPKKENLLKQKKHKQAVRESEKFVEKVKETVNLRDNASDAVKNVMDKARSGKVDAKDVMNYVDQMVEESSMEAVEAIASLKKSDQTYAHCTDVGAIFFNSYYKIKKLKNEAGLFKEPKMALFGSFMHDFGKAKVPKDILESTVRFERESKEMQMLQSHPVYGAELLSSMNMSDHIINMCQFHHVKMDPTLNSSYPRDVNYDDVLMETRLISIIDVYQALIGRRSYKKSWPPAAAIRYIDTLAGVEFDFDVWEDFMKVTGLYPIGSLVELSDKTSAFVLNVPEKDLARPRVAVVLDADGKEVKNNTLIDLEDEMDLSIVKDLDHYDIFGDRALEVFTQIQPA